MADGVFKSSEGYYYILKGRKSALKNKDKSVVAKEYVKRFVEANPKYKELLSGKVWPQIFKIMGIDVAK